MDDLSGSVFYISGNRDEHMVLQVCDIHRRGDKDYCYYDVINLSNYSIARRVPEGNLFKKRTLEHLASVVDSLIDKDEKAEKEKKPESNELSVFTKIIRFFK